MGFSNFITLTSKYQIQLKFLEDVQQRLLSLFLEFEHLTRNLMNFGSYELIEIEVWKSAGKWDWAGNPNGRAIQLLTPIHYRDHFVC